MRAEEDSGTRTTSRQQLRMRGNEAAAAYLERVGFSVATVNWRCPAGKVAVIAWDGPELVLVDVTTRRAGAMKADGKPMSQAKAKRLAKIAQAWIADNGVSLDQVRVDVVTIYVLAEDRALLRHHRGELTIPV